MAADPLDLAKAGIAAVLEHHVPGFGPEASEQRIAALVEMLAQQIALDLVREQGVFRLTLPDVECFLADFAAEAFMPAVLDHIQRLSMPKEIRH